MYCKFSGNWQSDSTWYRTETIFGEEAYLTTAYFVSPEIICTGRTQAEFDVDGTGNILLLTEIIPFKYINNN